MSEARQLFMEVSLAAQKQSFSEVEALNTFRGPQGPKGDPGSIDNLVINGKESVQVDGKNTINLTPEDVGALPSDGTAVNANALNGKDADEYALTEQGIWTPVIRGSNTNGMWTPESQYNRASYVRIGNLVFIEAQINGKLTGATGEIIVAGLPFNYNNFITGSVYAKTGVVGTQQTQISASGFIRLMTFDNFGLVNEVTGVIASTNLLTSTNSYGLYLCISGVYKVKE